jgi:hypothetical protein
MNRQHTLTAHFFLSIFSLLMLHSLVPHVHHCPEQHTEAAHQGAHHYHDPYDHHHQHDSDESSMEEKGDSFLLQFFLGSHVHSFHAHDYSMATSWQIKKVEKKILPLAPPFDHGGVSPPFDVYSRSWPHWCQNAVFNNPLLSQRSLRAPPSLV